MYICVSVLLYELQGHFFAQYIVPFTIYYTLYYIDMPILTEEMKDNINQYKYNSQIAKINGFLKEIMGSQAIFFENIKKYSELYVSDNLNNVDNDVTKDGIQNEDKTKFNLCKSNIEREIDTIQNVNAEILENLNTASQYKESVEPYTSQLGPLFNENSPQSMMSDITQLYNQQYLHLFCKFLGIIIIIYMFYSFFSSRPSSSLSSAQVVSSPSPSLPSVNV